MNSRTAPHAASDVFEAMHDLLHMYKAHMVRTMASIHPELTLNEVRALMFVGRHPGASQKELVAHLDHHKRYPIDRSDVSVKIMVSFEIDRTGHVISSKVVQGSGYPEFDQAALDMLKRSDPVPAPPPLIADEGLTFTLPVVFRAHGKKK